MNKAIIAIAFMITIFAAGCAEKNSDNNPVHEPAPVTYDAETQEIISNCGKICMQKLNDSQPLSNGPCLSNEIAPDWVCDAAHNPREAVDDLPENQCLMYRGGAAHHFVELDTECNLIRAV